VGAPQASPSDDDESEPGRPLPERLVTEFTAHRTLALREALANDPDVAFAVLHALALRAFYGQQSYDPGSCLEIEAKSSALSGAGNASTLGHTSAAQGLARMHEAWGVQLPKKPEELWDRLLDCDADTRSSLFAYCAARTINATH
jgi:ParB family transcriptional regulator, chromosome partitioning protein